KPLLSFHKVEAVWEREPNPDPKGPQYAGEYEVFTGGRLGGGDYDFPLDNVAGEPGGGGLRGGSCPRSPGKAGGLGHEEWDRYEKATAKAPLIKRTRDEPADDFAWKKLARDDAVGLTVPADGKGLVRLYWDGNKQEPERLNLFAQIWAGPHGRERERRP